MLKNVKFHCQNQTKKNGYFTQEPMYIYDDISLKLYLK